MYLYMNTFIYTNTQIKWVVKVKILKWDIYINKCILCRISIVTNAI